MHVEELDVLPFNSDMMNAAIFQSRRPQSKATRFVPLR